MTSGIDIDRIEREALRGLQPFQMATVEHVAALFKKGGGMSQRRVLVADEVGLGKTLVARGVIAKTARIRHDEGDNLFRVVYICSNQNIARQNLCKLQVETDLEGNDAKEAMTEARLSMLHLLIEEQEIRWKEKRRFVQLVPITPETSFRMGNREGRKEERALIYAILSEMPEFSSRKKALKNRLMGRTNTSWDELVDTYRNRIGEVYERRHSYPNWLYKELRAQKIKDAVDHLLAIKIGDPIGEPVRELRRIFAEISTKRLEPDLVIMDEFQRFRFLIQADENDETGVLAHQFLKGDGRNTPRILLLSATPFKPYSTKEETQCEGDEESFEEFKEVVRFLFPDRYPKVWSSWREYSDSLARHVDCGQSGAPPAGKEAVESLLVSGMCRTERSLVDDFVGEHVRLMQPVAVFPTESEIRAYAALAALAARIGDAGLPRIEQAKSTPYLLSFRSRDNYKEQEDLEKKFDKSPLGRRLLNGLSRNERKALWVDSEDVRQYREVPFSNARLKLLADIVFAQQADASASRTSAARNGPAFRPELCLWLPPSIPCYPCIGPFAGAEGYSKTLVFSSWEMVPKMIASLLSYEMERRTIARCYARDHRKDDSRLNYAAGEGKRYPSQRLRFQAKGGKPTTMSLFALLYPSQALANLFSPIESRNHGWTLDQAERHVRSALGLAMRRLAALQKTRRGPPDARWYYLAPMLLDKVEMAEAEKWAQEPAWKNNRSSKTADDEENLIKRHFKQLLKELATENLQLGRMPDDLREVLVDAALGSPAICALRAFNGDTIAATIVAFALRRYFDSPESVAAVDCAYARSDESHWRNILRYCKEGCLSSVLSEWRHLLRNDEGSPLDEGRIAGDMDSALNLRTTTYAADTFNALKARLSGSAKSSELIHFRSHFAVAFNKGEVDDIRGVNRREAVRAAFNSPFRPFVLASTSIGQEGLDFHLYCRKVFHWNLPSNPVDFEQREGRVDRYKGLSVRQSLAVRFADKHDFTDEDDLWGQVFATARRETERKGDKSGLSPFWRLSVKTEFPVESIVPLLTFSRDESALARIQEILNIYRLAIGHPRQEELLDRFSGNAANAKQLFLNLCPFARGRRRKGQ